MTVPTGTTPAYLGYGRVVTLDPSQNQVISVTGTTTTGSGTQTISPTGQLSTSSFVDVVGGVVDTSLYGESVVSFSVTVATQDVTIKILGSLNGTNYFALIPYDETGTAYPGNTTSVVAGATSFFALSPSVLSFFKKYKIQVKDTVGGVHGTATVNIFSK